jgi:hypothetical protein
MPLQAYLMLRGAPAQSERVSKRAQRPMQQRLPSLRAAPPTHRAVSPAANRGLPPFAVAIHATTAANRRILKGHGGSRAFS